MVKIAERAMEGFALASEPTTFMLGNFPPCRLDSLLALSGKLTMISETRAPMAPRFDI